ncbi:hypothetical protein SISSUDRAFT_1042394, partial [Sistotremastrum suecicum HHB10207 ss-3]
MIPPGPGEAPMTVYRSPSAFDIFDVAEVNHVSIALSPLHCEPLFPVRIIVC